ncbi:MAG: tRNA pseudouridine(55) synthase TruB [Pseudomonadota bacterium]
MSSLHGLLLVRKPSGMTSHDLVYQVRRALGIKEVGHAGTLDPLAEGLMVLLLGEATKMSSYVLEQDKQYEVEFKPGIETDTLDITGAILQERPVTLSNEEIIAEALKLHGDFVWEVPMYSATKVGGKKLYEQARAGETPVMIPKKSMSFWGVEYLEGRDGQKFRFRLNCSKGSFIRTWVQQLGQTLGFGAVMTGLCRTYSAPYSLDRAIDLKDLSPEIGSDRSGAFISLLAALPHFKTIRVSGHSEGLIKNGQISHELRRQLIVAFDPEKDQGVKVISQRPEELLALVGLEKEKGFVVRRVFRY